MNPVALASHMECPACHRKYREGYGVLFFPACQSRTCRTRWWSMQLFEGDLLTQLEITFGNEGATSIIQMLDNPPLKLDSPRFLSIVISGRDFHRLTRDKFSVREILKTLLRAA